MDAKKLRKMYEKSVANLDIVFNSREILMQLNSENFKDLLVTQVSILNFLEQEIAKSPAPASKTSKKEEISYQGNAKKYLDRLNQILNSSKDFLPFSFNNEVDIQDEINYLEVYIKNTFNKELKEFKKNIESVKAEPVGSIPNNTANAFGAGMAAGAASNSVPNQGQSYGGGGFGNSFGGGFNRGFGGANPYGPEAYNVQEQIYLQLAQQRLNADIMQGKFYMYKSKPKIVPILKMISGILCGVFALLTIIDIILFSTSASQLTLPSSFTGATGDTKINELQSVVVGGWFLQVVMAIAGTLCCYSMLKPKKNENQIYSFTWMYVAFFVFLAAIWISSIVTYTVNSVNITNWLYTDEGSTYASNSSTYIDVFAGHTYVQITSYALIGVVFILCIITGFLAPKRDIERIQLKLAEYVEEMKAANSRNF